MVAAASDLRWRVTEIATCPICLEGPKSPRMLPCVHSFCLQCLEGHCKDKSAGNDVTCPVCRKKFQIPQNGLEGLPHNFFVQNLIDARDVSGGNANEELCEICADERVKEGGRIPSATVFCIDCNQKLCNSCSKPCRSSRKGGPHDVKAIEEVQIAELIKLRSSFCEYHKEDRMKLYCFGCEKNVCLRCIALDDHSNCKFGDIGRVAKEVAEMMDLNTESVASRIEEFIAGIAQMDEASNTFLSAIEKEQKVVQQRQEAEKDTTGIQVQKLLLDMLESVKICESKNVQTRLEEMKLALTSLESFKCYMQELKAKGSPCDITSAAKALRCRANELLQTYVSPSDYCAPCVTHTRMNATDLTSGTQNVIAIQIRSKTSDKRDASFAGVEILHSKLTQTIQTGVVSGGSQINELPAACESTPFSQLEEQPPDTTAYDKLHYGMDSHPNMVDDFQTESLRIALNREYRIVIELRSRMKDLEVEVEKLQEELRRTLESESVLRNQLRHSQEELQEVIDRETRAQMQQRLAVTNDRAIQFLESQEEKVARVQQEYGKSAAHMVRTVEGKEMVSGVTKLQDKLFVLRGKSIEIYDMCPFGHNRNITLRDMNADHLNDMVSNSRDTCLHVADCGNNCIRKIKPSERDKVTVFTSVDKPRGLSETSNHTLLVTCHGDRNVLLEFDTSGNRVRQLSLHLDIKFPHHAVQLSSDQYVVCFSAFADLQQVCIVDTDGEIIRRYGGLGGSRLLHLNLPYHATVDNDGFIFVADRRNNRIVLLNKSLQFVSYVIEKLQSEPLRLHFYEVTGLSAPAKFLYVGLSNGNVMAMLCNYSCRGRVHN